MQTNGSGTLLFRKADTPWKANNEDGQGYQEDVKY
jgi:hypothetical protein